ncbi:photosynthetic complex assembly protein PuhC [Aurantimonas sp. 22II-16-19i]|uniref:photosynthetic complex assembly protein PuhC n=1 Tax=Aurantimonas sp. 22II-16-19i TaxID=1317114 RepID=UPI0009F7C327|nr:photosynthetic complex assembly protein PuhC [Aurantimonas sp. 22II-16-19i]ORE92754.1 photosynthetic complex assembly protein PuhC [Aurantimonas sp. 22II-16-19i]
MRALAAAIRNGSIKISPDSDKPIPRPILMAAEALAFAALAAIATGRTTGVGLADTPDIATLAHRDLQLAEHDDGSAAVIDAVSRATLIEVGPGSGAFAVEVLRNLARDRIRKGAAAEDGPYVLALKADGRLVVEDPQTRQQVELRAFGKLQAEAFAGLMPAADAANKGGAK